MIAEITADISKLVSYQIERFSSIRDFLFDL